MKQHPSSNALPEAAGLRIAVVSSRYHDTVTSALRDGAVEAFSECGGDPADVVSIEAPGTWELPVLCSALLEGDEAPDAVVAIGCVIAGETSHDQHINSGVSNALAQLSIRTGVPVAFGVLTCSSMEQARARSGGEVGNKGRESMLAAIEAVQTIRSIRTTEHAT